MNITSAEQFYRQQNRLQRILDWLGWLTLFFSAAGIFGLVKLQFTIVWWSFTFMLLCFLIGIVIALYRAQTRDRYYANYY